MRQPATVIRISRRGALVRLEARSAAGRMVRCTMGGRLFGRRRAGAPVVGDEVEIEEVTPRGGRQIGRRRSPGGRITRVLPRRNTLRRAVGPLHRREMRTFAANLDRFFIVSAFREPPYRTGFVDRSLVVAFHAGVTPAFVFNKSDLADEADFDRLREDLGPYRALGLETHITSALEGGGLARLRRAASTGRSVLFGHSGVGKTALLAALGIPDRRIGPLDRRGRGRHTTTGAEVLPLPDGGEIVDTPGVRALGLDGLTPAQVRAAHPDLTRLAERCRFPGCIHASEPDCAVKEAVSAGEVARRRYDGLIQLAAEAAGLDSHRPVSEEVEPETRSDASV